MGDRNHYIDAVYYYMRRYLVIILVTTDIIVWCVSLSSPDPFTGAEANLKQIYEKNSKKLQALVADKEGRTSEDGMRLTSYVLSYIVDRIYPSF